MDVQFLPKTKKISKVVSNKVFSGPIEEYFMRYLTFQNKIVKKVNLDLNEN